ncbi:MAG: beta-ketoacyl-ACP synthase III [bacterium]|nr:beta-ketoacyl-ACP synthase III [bacterium]
MTQDFRSVITGVGSALPSRAVSNAQISAEIVAAGGEPSDDEWLVTRTGIKSRRVGGPDETPSTLGAVAAAQALERAGRRPDEINEIIVATCTPDHKTPATACLVHQRLGCPPTTMAVDLNGACSGFVYALRYADAVVRQHRTLALVIGAEKLTSIANPADRATRPLFGDGAGAVVLEPRYGHDGILDFEVGTNGADHDCIKVDAGGSRLPSTTPGLPANALYLRMNGPEVFKFATRIIVEMVEKLCTRHGLRPHHLDLIVPHQANWRIIEAAARRLHYPLERVAATVQIYGNTSAASIPIALDQALADGKVQPGHHVLICGFGAGLTWGGALIRWAKPA